MKKNQEIGVLLFLITIVIPLYSFAQDINGVIAKPTPITTVTKVDEFTSPLNECDMGLRVDILFNILKDSPNTKGYIISYNGADQLPVNYNSARNQARLQAEIIKNIKFRQYDESRIVFINGGFREKLINEVWIVPDGENPPELTNTIPKPNLPTDKTFLYNKEILVLPYHDIEPYEFLLPSIKAEVDKARKEFKAETGEEINDSNDDSGLTKKELEELKFFWASQSFGDVIKNQNDSRGMIIFYADSSRLNINKIKKHIEKGKLKISKEAKIPPSKIKIVYGGYRDIIQAELWIIPKNGIEPKPVSEAKEELGINN